MWQRSVLQRRRTPLSLCWRYLAESKRRRRKHSQEHDPGTFLVAMISLRKAQTQLTLSQLSPQAAQSEPQPHHS